MDGRCNGAHGSSYPLTSSEYSQTTNISGLGIGFASAFARVGSILTPYVLAQVLFYTNDYATIGIYAGTCLCLAFVEKQLAPHF